MEASRLESNVTQIFDEVVGIKTNPLPSDIAVIQFWEKSHGWKEYEFRLLLDYQWKNPSTRTWLTSEAGRMNIRNFLNPKNADKILSILHDLKQADQIKASVKSAEKGGGSDFTSHRIRLQCCGEIHERRFMKVWHQNVGPNDARFHWKEVNLDEYEQHYIDCLKRSQALGKTNANF